MPSESLRFRLSASNEVSGSRGQGQVCFPSFCSNSLDAGAMTEEEGASGKAKGELL